MWGVWWIVLKVNLLLGKFSLQLRVNIVEGFLKLTISTFEIGTLIRAQLMRLSPTGDESA